MTRQELEDLIANAIRNPGAYVAHGPVELAGITFNPNYAQWAARAVLAALRAPDDEPHIFIVGADLETWSLEHPLQCRFDDLAVCEVHQAAVWLTIPPAKPGRYKVTVEDGKLIIGEVVTP